MADFDPRSVSLTMRQRRKYLKYSQSEIAAKLGISRKTLSNWENDDNDNLPSKIITLQLWANSLGLTLTEAIASAPLPDEHFFMHPAHLANIRFFCSRYIQNSHYANLVHRLTASDDKMLKAISAFIEGVLSTDEDHVARMDKAREKVTHLTNMKGIPTDQ
jgi:transcriptional regulator with XRE-family HTH domain